MVVIQSGFEKGDYYTMAIDPVCGIEIDLDQAREQVGETLHGAAEVDPKKGTRAFHDGQWYYFHSADCRSKFLFSPDSYLKKEKS